MLLKNYILCLIIKGTYKWGEILDFIVSEFFKDYGYRQKDIEKAKVFEMILACKGATRKKLYLELQVRPNNVSSAVQDLIDDGLVYEDVVLKSTKQGRPRIKLAVHVNKLLVIGLWIETCSLIGGLVNMAGDVIQKQEVELSGDVDNEGFYRAVNKIVVGLIKAVEPKQELLGIGFALPGVINKNKKIWIFNSRFPNVENLSFENLESKYGVPTKIYSKLESVFSSYILKKKKDFCHFSTFMLHWGYGIGGAYCYNGEVMHSNYGSSCEIGHLKLPERNGKKCCCGDYDCIETVAAGWALKPLLAKEYGNLGNDDFQFADRIENMDFSKDEYIQNAIKALASGLNTTFRIFYPERLIVYGPFFRNEGVRKCFTEEVMKNVPFHIRNYLKIILLDEDFSKYSHLGCTNEFFDSKLKELLISAL